MGLEFEGISSRCEFFPLTLARVKVLDKLVGTLLLDGARRNRSQRSLAVSVCTMNVPDERELRGPQASPPTFSINDFEVEFFEMRTHRSNLPLAILFCKEILNKGGMVLTGIVDSPKIVFSSTFLAKTAPIAKSLASHISSNGRSQFGCNQRLELPLNLKFGVFPPFEACGLKRERQFGKNSQRPKVVHKDFQRLPQPWGVNGDLEITGETIEETEVFIPLPLNSSAFWSMNGRREVSLRHLYEADFPQQSNSLAISDGQLDVALQKLHTRDGEAVPEFKPHNQWASRTGFTRLNLEQQEVGRLRASVIAGGIVSLSPRCHD
ncbi:hypothetical protein Tco_0109002 [Tanacetum coccineum]